jgi:two-component system sensor histidine kinase/response regulator
MAQSLAADHNKRSISIRNKLKLAILGFSLLTLIIFTLAITFTAYSYFHKKTRLDLQVLANVFSQNVSASVIFNDSLSATKILSTLKATPHIQKATIFKDYQNFASYPEHQPIDNKEITNMSGTWFANGNYFISVPIIVTDKTVGRLVLISDVKEWDNIENNLYTIFVIIVIILVLLTFFVSVWLESQITNPLQEISDWAMNIAKTQNFSTRAYKKNSDEIGDLVDSLNTMLTELVKQESIVAINKKLTKEIAEREKFEKELVSLRTQADSANQSKSLFLANMSHEIRTPLNGVIGMTNLLLRTNLDPLQNEYSKAIQQSGQTLLTIINEILDFSKIESGSILLENIDFNLHVLIEKTTEILAPLAHTKGLAIGTFINTTVPVWVRGEPTKLRQILTNLLGNAIKFTSKGGVELHVSSETKDKEIMLRFEIIDTGIGINPDVRSHLFKTFSQGDNTTSRKYGGTGLGLVISKRLVELMGGQLDVESREHQGSKFWFTIHATTASHKKSIKKKNPSTDLHGLPVLIVDDSSINRHNLSQQAESWGMRCDTVENGFEAIAKLRAAIALNEPYTLCIIDYAMPMMSGIDLAKEIRKHPQISHTPLIMMIPLGYPIPTQELKSISIQNVITQPVRQSLLFENIVAILNTKTHKKINATVNTDQNQIMDETTPLAKQKSARILLAEDNPINQQVAICTLQALGYNADLANNGLEALNFLKKSSFDLVLMDCQMPEMDGYSATREIRKLEHENHLKHTPVIAMTASALIGDKEKCLSAGMDDYISKPIDITQLEEVLKRWLKK